MKIGTLLLVFLTSISAFTMAALPVTDGLIIHFQADALSLNDNEPVTTWPDSATSDAVNGTVSQYSTYGVPTYKTNAINGLPAVRFTRPADPGTAPTSQLQLLVSPLWTWDKMQGVTVFIVCTGGLETVEQRAVQVGKTNGTEGKTFICDACSNQSGVRFNNGYCLGTSPFTRGQWHISTRQIAHGGGLGSAWYRVNDGSPVNTTTNAAATNVYFENGNNDITLGAGWHPSYGIINWYDGDIAEVLVYNKQLTPAQMRQVSLYLNTKYRLYQWGKNFTIVQIPDSQGYIEQGDTFLMVEEMQYIRDNINTQNIAFVSHVGDFMTSSTTAHYNAAVTGMQPLLNTIPTGWVPGNHDYDSADPSVGATLWNSHFDAGSNFFRDKSWYGGVCTNSQDSSGMTSWQTFSTADIDFLHIAFECEPSDAVLSWAQGIINAHPGYPTILTTHKFVGTGGGRPGASLRNIPRNDGDAIWNEFMKINPQIFMLFCGHYCDKNEQTGYVYACSARRTDNNNSGYPVYQMMADYQRCISGNGWGNGGGWLRLLEFSPTTNTVRAKTYSTILNKYSSHSSLTDGSTYSRNWAGFNYKNEGSGSLHAESDFDSSEFTLPFIYGRQLPYPAEIYGENIAGCLKSFTINITGDLLPTGVVFDPSYKTSGNYDRLYFVNRVTTGTQGLYSLSIAAKTTSARLALGSYGTPHGCAVDAGGKAYVCYPVDPAVWKVTNPSGTPSSSQLLGNYRGAGDDEPQSVMMVPKGFGGSYDEGTDLILIDSGLDSPERESIVAIQSNSTGANPQFTVLYEDTNNYFASDIRGAASDFDGFVYIAPITVQSASLSGTVRPYINRFKPGSFQRIYLDTDITRGDAAPFLDDSITVDPANGSVWIATAASTSESLVYPRTVWRIDVQNAVDKGSGNFLAPVTAEITNLYINIGVNGMAWSPDGKYLALICPDHDKAYIYTAAVPSDCSEAIDMGYGLAYDYNDDCKVNLIDFAAINIGDLAQFAIQWLECVDPQTCTWIWP